MPKADYGSGISGAASGASTGAIFGPVGAGVGGIVGAFTGLFGGKKKRNLSASLRWIPSRKNFITSTTRVLPDRAVSLRISSISTPSRLMMCSIKT